MNINKYLPYVFGFAIMITFIVLLSFGLKDLKPKPQFYHNGKGYRTQLKCVQSHDTTKWGMHYGYSWSRGKWCYHYGRYTETICDENVVDTIEVR